MRVLVLALALILGSAPGLSAWAGDIDFKTVVRGKDPFKDLPGVRIEEDDRLKSHLDCETGVVVTKKQLRARASDEAGALPPAHELNRFYSCRDGNMIFESNRPPMDYDWGVYKRHQR